MFAKYIGGIIGLTKDAFRLMVFLLKRPHYVAVLLAGIIGIFYLNGIPPQEISGFLSGKWQAFVENRKQTFQEDYQLLSERFLDKNPAVSAPLEKEMIIPDEKQEILKLTNEQIAKQMREEVFGWQQAFHEAQKEIKIPDENVVQGVLTVVSADKVRVDGKVFLLNVKLRSGKAGEAYRRLSRQFDGRNAKCVPNDGNPEKAECFVGGLGVSEMLIDLGLAEPLL